MKKILITGGAGYVGAELVPRLLELGYIVTVLDLMIYGEDVLLPHLNLKVVKGDIRNLAILKKVLDGQDIVIHLACISNDPSFELNPLLGKSINLDAFEPLVLLSKELGIKRFIYASSSSVYGVKKVSNVHEEMDLEPLTDYSKFKADCEIILNKHCTKDFIGVTIRPATVCGYSRRQRLDVVVNILTNYAYNKREINIFGGNQLRPNIHIQDMVDAYICLIKAPKELVSGQIFNAGYENHSVMDLAKMVKQVVGEDVSLNITVSDDNRSYHISSEKIANVLGFFPKRTIRMASEDLRDAFVKGLLPNSLSDERYFNIKRMQSISLE